LSGRWLLIYKGILLAFSGGSSQARANYSCLARAST
jgi:hypothetical protein